jgi:hypothetical protein
VPLRDFGEKIAWLKKLTRENVNARKKERREKKRVGNGNE